MTKTKRDCYILYYAPFVAKGVKFLNKNVPGWTRPNKLAIFNLDLCDPNRCVLGQLAAKSAGGVSSPLTALSGVRLP